MDDLIIASKDPKGLVDILTIKHKFKLKETNTTSCHIGCDFRRDDDGAIHFAPRKHIDKLI